MSGAVIFHLIVKHPRARGSCFRVQDPVKAVSYIRSHHFASMSSGKMCLILEKNICSQVKNIFPAAVIDFPAFGKRGLDMQAVVQFYQRIKNLVHQPDIGLGFGKGGVERIETCSYVPVEYIPVLMGIILTASAQNDRG